jgi:hypothetical protein
LRAAYASIRQHTSAYDVSIREHITHTVYQRRAPRGGGPPLRAAYVSIRQHTSACI